MKNMCSLEKRKLTLQNEQHLVEKKTRRDASCHKNTANVVVA